MLVLFLIDFGMECTVKYLIFTTICIAPSSIYLVVRILINFGTEHMVKYLVCTTIYVAPSSIFQFMVATFTFATLAIATLYIVDPNSTLALFAFNTIVAFAFNGVVVFVVGGFVPPPDSEAITKELTKEEATEETGVKCSSQEEKK